ncbi:transketolase family protein [Pseudoalteromonas luteoviolacea]|uniref:Transketolase n=1 Tax=Pseudoalteromonas luteoviolacea H33 TaxID=1365251 RepID=A0A167C361_9GAMM|nr:transketolase C-terminal domain-containing protein [Pseudoalteromonas luteoviolacea]KZN47181.1 transketolase [Pseudoalteromonas luteoviolacea H33]KZN77203.1 transketolase [Pseudoalteromonas luteoviolacea H33-S]
MRNAFARVLTELAKEDQRLLLFYADIGNRLFNPLKEFASDRAINAGIAEANMASMAAGSAMMGHKPFIYTITPFTTARNFEQIKIDIAYQNQPVIIVGTGSGLSYANLGPTHHSFEDIALMRSLPNMNIVCPADAQELEILMPQLIELNQPCYFRIGKKNEPSVHDAEPALKFGQAHTMVAGEKVTILATGTITPLAQALHYELSTKGINAELVSFHTVKPLDEDYLTSASARFDHIVTLEEHNVNGGFGSAVLEFCSELNSSPRIHRFGIPDKFIDQVHSPGDARAQAGLTVENIITILSKRGIV